ncbi:hypothetical protein PENTCL1PPCAC_26184 [Pristionchus entomophagus]|uniref:Uncharacterized protein n=1 Tax=Pristionchus entomophagus TaxID=358040 RepID=A0AAV5UAU1_9BILA|nr:hypothetical protein PENTCL1PPCAC_26184 [Pristionchus entomophagus]
MTSEGLTLFARLEDEEENETAQQSSTILGSIFKGWFKGGEAPPSTVPGPSGGGGGGGGGGDTTVDTVRKEEEEREKERESPGGTSVNSQSERKISATSSLGRSGVGSLFGRWGEGGGLIDYNRSDHRQYWMPDSTGARVLSVRGQVLDRQEETPLPTVRPDILQQVLQPPS